MTGPYVTRFFDAWPSIIVYLPAVGCWQEEDVCCKQVMNFCAVENGLSRAR
jgi:hypothetical protein